MFQTEPILWLQAHSSTALTWLLSAITLLGYAPTYAAAVLALAFGVRLRPGLGVLLTLLVSAVLTEGLKNGLALPRPSDVDARVHSPAVVPGRAPHVAAVSAATRGGAETFWGLPAPEAIAAARARAGANHGFPSGHVSAAVAFVLSTSLFYGPRRFALAALPWPLLMGLSRMYLGRHFLADVLGGLAVGGAAMVATALLLREFDGTPVGPRPARLGPVAVVAGLLACLVPVVPALEPESVGRLAGCVAAYGVLQILGLPPDHGTLAQRFGRVVVSAVVLLVVWGANTTLILAGRWQEQRPAVMLADAVVMTLTLVGGVTIARRLGFYSAR